MFIGSTACTWGLLVMLTVSGTAPSTMRQEDATELHLIGIYTTTTVPVEFGFSPYNMEKWRSLFLELAFAEKTDKLKQHIRSKLPPQGRDMLESKEEVNAFATAKLLSKGPLYERLQDWSLQFNRLLDSEELYQEGLFPVKDLPKQAKPYLEMRGKRHIVYTRYVNRCLLHLAFPDYLPPSPIIPGVVQVQVKKTKQPIILALCSHDACHWQVTLEEGARVKKIILGGHHSQEIDPVGVPVEYHTDAPSGPKQEKSSSSFSCCETTDESYHATVKTLRDLTGLQVRSFQGHYGYLGERFQVPKARSFLDSRPLEEGTELHLIGVHVPIPVEFEFDIGNNQSREGWRLLFLELARAEKTDKLKQHIRSKLPAKAQVMLESPEEVNAIGKANLIRDRPIRERLKAWSALFNELLECEELYQEGLFSLKDLPVKAKRYLDMKGERPKAYTRYVNRWLLHLALPDYLPPTPVMPGVVQVHVKKTKQPIVLALCAYNSCHWQVTLEEGAQVKGIIVGGYHSQEIDVIGVPVAYHTYEPSGPNKVRSKHLFHCCRTTDEDYAKTTKALHELTGLQIRSFQGDYNYRGNPYRVPKE